MLDGYAVVTIVDLVSDYRCIVAIAGPNPVTAVVKFILNNKIRTECSFDAICHAVREVVSVDNIPITSAGARIHRVLPRPEEKAIATVCGAVVGNNIVIALLVKQDAGRILTAVVFAMAIAAYVPVEAVVHDPV